MRKLIGALLALGMAIPMLYARQPGGPAGIDAPGGDAVSLSMVAGRAAIKVKVVIARANVRSAADANADVLQVVELGQTFEVIEKRGEWYQIVLPGGRKGFIFNVVVEEIADAVKPPVPQPQPKPQPQPQPVKPAEKPAPAVYAVPVPAGDVVPFSMVVGRAGFFLASDSAYKDIYGNGLVYGLELRIGKKKLVGWLEGSFRSRTGKSSFTKEETKASVMGVEAGALYRFQTGSLSPYLGAGLGYYSFKESNTFIGEVSKGGVGFAVLGGASYSVSSRLVLDGRIKYSSCSMKPADFDINIGGITIGLGIGVRF